VKKEPIIPIKVDDFIQRYEERKEMKPFQLLEKKYISFLKEGCKDGIYSEPNEQKRIKNVMYDVRSRFYELFGHTYPDKVYVGYINEGRRYIKELVLFKPNTPWGIHWLIFDKVKEKGYVVFDDKEHYRNIEVRRLL